MYCSTFIDVKISRNTFILLFVCFIFFVKISTYFLTLISSSFVSEFSCCNRGSASCNCRFNIWSLVDGVEIKEEELTIFWIPCSSLVLYHKSKHCFFITINATFLNTFQFIYTIESLTKLRTIYTYISRKKQRALASPGNPSFYRIQRRWKLMVSFSWGRMCGLLMFLLRKRMEWRKSCSLILNIWSILPVLTIYWCQRFIVY